VTFIDLYPALPEPGRRKPTFADPARWLIFKGSRGTWLVTAPVGPKHGNRVTSFPDFETARAAFAAGHNDD
jgi:hypothetical protein